MKISAIIPLLAAPALASTELRGGRQLQQCANLDNDFGSGTFLDDTRQSDGIVVPLSRSIKCTVQCSTEIGLKFYMMFGGGTIDATTADAVNENMGCGETMEAKQSSSAVTSGFGYRIIADSYSGLSVNCGCPDETRSVSGGGCFSESATVQVLNRGEVTMKDLQVGDSVMVSADKYEPVYSFGHVDTTSAADFVQIYTDAITKPLELTENHLVYVDGSAVRADSVKVGDMINTASNGPQAVTKISTVNKNGLYMPLTESGKVVVDGVVASSYTSIMDYAPGIVQHPLLFWLSEHNLAHGWMAPYRMLCLGVSSGFCDGSFTEEGVLSFLWSGKDLAEFAQRQNTFVQILMGIFVIGSLLALNLVEFVFGAAVAPLALVLAAGYAIRRQKMAQQMNAPGAAIKTKTA